MNSEYHDQVGQPIIFKRGTTLVAIVMLIAGCSGGAGGPENPPPNPPQPAPANPSGLDARPGNTSCVAPERATSSATLGTQRVFPNLDLRFANHPISLQQVPGDSSRWFVVEQEGFVRVFDNDEGATASSLFIDLTSRADTTCAECGVLGMAFHPDFPATPRVYLSYTSAQRTLGGPDSVLSEFTSRDGGLTLDPDSERIILRIHKTREHHHGGRIIFGPDGFLYLGMGDGSFYANDNAQDLTRLLGKIVRIDIRGTTGTALYRIPADNPFAASTTLCSVNGSGPQNCPEIYAWGFRNPWGWSFDRQTGDLWVGDVGESAIEEVNRVERGGNYGWRCFEGTQDISARWPSGAACATRSNLLPPGRRVPARARSRRHGRLCLPWHGHSGTRWPLCLRRLHLRAHLGHSERHAAHDDDDEWARIGLQHLLVRRGPGRRALLRAHVRRFVPHHRLEWRRRRGRGHATLRHRLRRPRRTRRSPRAG